VHPVVSAESARQDHLATDVARNDAADNKQSMQAKADLSKPARNDWRRSFNPFCMLTSESEMLEGVRAGKSAAYWEALQSGGLGLLALIGVPANSASELYTVPALLGAEAVVALAIAWQIHHKQPRWASGLLLVAVAVRFVLNFIALLIGKFHLTSMISMLMIMPAMLSFRSALRLHALRKRGAAPRPEHGHNPSDSNLVFQMPSMAQPISEAAKQAALAGIGSAAVHSSAAFLSKTESAQSNKQTITLGARGVLISVTTLIALVMLGAVVSHQMNGNPSPAPKGFTKEEIDEILGRTPAAQSVPVQGAMDSSDGSFTNLELPRGISISIPAHWTILSKDDLLNLGAATESISPASDNGKEALLAVNSSPEPHGAQLRISITSPLPYSKDDLLKMTPSDLKLVSDGLLSSFKALEDKGGIHVLEMYDSTIEQIDGHAALHMSYLRSSMNEGPNWRVEQYKIPVSDHLVELTLSYRDSERSLWQPILTRSMHSLSVS